MWFQGYNDQAPWAKNVYCREQWSSYKNNLIALITDLRKELGVQFPVVVVKANHAVDSSISQAQDEAVAALQNVRSTESKDMSNCFHYDSGSMVVIGEEAADAMLELLGSTMALPADGSTPAPTITTPPPVPPTTSQAPDISAGWSQFFKSAHGYAMGCGYGHNMEDEQGNMVALNVGEDEGFFGMDNCLRACLRHKCVKFRYSSAGGTCHAKFKTWLSANRDAATGTALDPALHTCGTGDVWVRKGCAACTSADCPACSV